VYPVVFEVDGFRAKECPNDDISPCATKPHDYPPFSVTFGAESKSLDKP
jgi:hypothetical protein